MRAAESHSSRRTRFPVGPEVFEDGVSFRVWAPKRNKVRLLLEQISETLELTPGAGGYFEGFAPSMRSGDLYRFLLDDDPQPYPDPASHFQPQGPHGPSQVFDPRAFQWTDASWPGAGPRGQVIYEMHIGTFTPEGTWDAARRQLPELKSAGITVLEIMPIADFAGRWGWGYDGVNLFAPSRLYGTPDDARRFIDDAHRIGLGVILDVVYNHLGPDGNYLPKFSDAYFSPEVKTDWGEAINFSCRAVREFYAANAAWWIGDFHFDGLRFDATQDIHDRSAEHILSLVARSARAAAGARSIYLVAENEPQQARIVRPIDAGGYGFDALWNDDFHHSALVALTGRNEAYYKDYSGAPQEFVSTAKYGYLYQGQWYSWQKHDRGASALDLEPWNFVTCLQNHDQVANTARGERPNVIAAPARYRAMTALLLLGPSTPMLFQGQEFGATTPFLYFSDHKPELSRNVIKGRRKFLAQFPSMATAAAQARIPDPAAPSTFLSSKLDFTERERNREMYKLHRDLLRLRAEDPVLSEASRRSFDGATLGANAFLLRYFGGPNGDRMLIVNLGNDLAVNQMPEPLVAPPGGRRWALLWSSEDPQYGGSGALGPRDGEHWIVPGNSSVFVVAAADSDKDKETQ